MPNPLIIPLMVVEVLYSSKYTGCDINLYVKRWTEIIQELSQIVVHEFHDENRLAIKK